MTGFEGVAAAIGVAELTLRSISRVYELVKYIKDAPTLVDRLRSELRDLCKWLSQLDSLSIAGSPARIAIQSFDLSAQVSKCGLACSSLETNLHKWTADAPETLKARVRVRINKSQIESAIRDIASTKVDLHLAVSLASLRLQSDMSGQGAAQTLERQESDPRDLHTSTTGTYTQGPLVRQSQLAMSHRPEQPGVSQAVKKDSEDENSKGPEVITGPSVEEVFITEKHEVKRDRIQNSANSTIGAPAAMNIRKYISEDNQIVDSNNSIIGRY